MSSSKGSHQMSKSDSSRIQSTQATGGKNMSSSGFAARAQSAADQRVTSVSSGGENQHDSKHDGGGRGHGCQSGGVGSGGQGQGNG